MQQFIICHTHEGWELGYESHAWIKMWACLVRSLEGFFCGGFLH